MLDRNEGAPEALGPCLAAQARQGFVKVIGGAGLFCWMTFALHKGSHLVTNRLSFFWNSKVDHDPPENVVEQ
jgi:hypothetical protein